MNRANDSQTLRADERPLSPFLEAFIDSLLEEIDDESAQTSDAIVSPNRRFAPGGEMFIKGKG